MSLAVAIFAATGSLQTDKGLWIFAVMTCLGLVLNSKTLFSAESTMGDVLGSLVGWAAGIGALIAEILLNGEATAAYQYKVALGSVLVALVAFLMTLQIVRARSQSYRYR